MLKSALFQYSMTGSQDDSRQIESVTLLCIRNLQHQIYRGHCTADSHVRHFDVFLSVTRTIKGQGRQLKI